MALPGDRERPIIPPQRWRLAIGETYIRDGRALPRKLDYFTIRRLSYQAGEAPIYVIDQAMQAAMCRAAGVTEKPTSIPVRVIGNPYIDAEGHAQIGEAILWSRMAYYSGGRCVCACSEFDAEGRGQARRRRFNGPKLATEEIVACDPKTCPFATGDHGLDKYKGVALCKPQVTATFSLPWAPVVGSVARFKTTGWHNYVALRNSLLTIASQTGGWLHDLPLWLSLEWERATNGKLVPATRIEYRGSVADLRHTALETKRLWVGQEAEIKQLAAGVVEAIEREESSPAEQAATSIEFYGPPGGAPLAEYQEGEFSNETDNEDNREEGDGEGTSVLFEY